LGEANFVVGSVTVNGGQTESAPTQRWMMACSATGCGTAYLADLPKDRLPELKCRKCGSTGHIKAIKVEDIKWVEGDGEETSSEEPVVPVVAE